MEIKKRTMIFMYIIILVLLVLVLRLGQVQLFATENFTKHHINLIDRSVSQRTYSYVIDEGRGKFVDRNKEQLTTGYEYEVIMFPFLKDIEWPVDRVAAIMRTKIATLKEEIRENETPVAFPLSASTVQAEEQMNSINRLEIPGVVAIKKRVEQEPSVARHLIGIVGENRERIENNYKDNREQGKIHRDTLTGISGLQYAFDEFLLTDGETRLLYHVDRKGNPLFGYDVKYAGPGSPFYPLTIETTLNKKLQQIGEDVIRTNGIKKGGLVLLDVETNNILAMVSTPFLDRSQYQETAVNQMLTRHFPGSVFKTVIAAAAIEKRIYVWNRRFNCDLDVYGELSKRPLGMLSLTESFAKSCNATFALLGNELIERNENVMEEYARKIGLEDRVGWRGDVFHYTHFKQFPEEEENIIWEDIRDKSVKKAISQTSIGQKNVQYTPLAIANMMATIARDGKKLEVKVVERMTYENGASFYEFKEHEGDDELKPYTIKKIQELLKEVVTKEGTGAFLEGLPYEVAGKSGTAEVRVNERDKRVNKWFAGYFPYAHPKYALVVVDLDSPSEVGTSIHAFRDYVEALFTYDQNISH